MAVAAIGYRTTDALALISTDIDRTHQAIEALDQVLVNVGAAGSARRAYLLGGEGVQLEKLAAAEDEARTSFARARELAVDDDGRQTLDRAAELLSERLASFDDSVAQRRQEGASLGDSPTREEVDLMNRLRSSILDAVAGHKRALGERHAHARQTSKLAKAVDLCGTGIAVAIVLLTFMSLRKETRRARTAHDQAERASRFLDSILEHLPAMVFLKEAKDLRFERMNQAGENLLGLSRKDLLGKSDRDFFPEEQAKFFQAKDRQTLTRGIVVDIPEEPITTKLGPRWLHTRKVPLLDEAGRPAYLLGISEDVTERKRAAEALKEAKEKAESVSRDLESFAYSVAHDLRSPLRGIDGFSRALLEDCGDALDAVGKEHVRRVLSATERMAQLIDDMLGLAHLSRVQIQNEDVDLSALAAESVETLRHLTPHRDVVVQIAPSIRTRADPRLLRIVLDNLLGNAFKFTGRRPRATIEVGSTMDAGQRVYFVRDDGVGFDERHAKKLFGPFQRLHNVREFPGSGIGLATVQRIVSRHGGRVWARGEPDRGATISFTLGEEPIESAAS